MGVKNKNLESPFKFLEVSSENFGISNANLGVLDENLGVSQKFRGSPMILNDIEKKKNYNKAEKLK